ncbi:MAG: diphthamide synthesis protein [Candidatus Woesearchaeota archaeon]|nr:diphthamide synthesis protein [Candidatus Woesearchaeota archaeon]
MQKIFIEAHSKVKISLPGGEISKLPKRIGLFTTVQHIREMPKVREELEKNGKIVLTGKGKRTAYPGQVLGCDAYGAERISGEVDAFLYIGSGKFHPIGIALSGKKPVFCFDPFSKRFEKLDEKEVEKVIKKKKGALVKFLSSNEIGLLVSIKPGQSIIRNAILAKGKIEKLGKRCYILLFDTLDFSELDNFPFIECFVNMACPRISEDYLLMKKPVAEYNEISAYLK